MDPSKVEIVGFTTVILMILKVDPFGSWVVFCLKIGLPGWPSGSLFGPKWVTYNGFLEFLGAPFALLRLLGPFGGPWGSKRTLRGAFGGAMALKKDPSGGLWGGLGIKNDPFLDKNVPKMHESDKK